jgi:hypothetical protein
MRTVAVLVLSLAFPSTLHASGSTSQSAAETLESAIFLAGPSIAGLPIVLAPVPPDGASRGVEAWTLPPQDNQAAQIVIYSGSGLFRCASDPDRLDYQCLLKLASTIIHEAWHYRHGVNEAGAYEAQIAFLTFHGAASAQITDARLSRHRVLAAQQAIERRRVDR